MGTIVTISTHALMQTKTAVHAAHTLTTRLHIKVTDHLMGIYMYNVYKFHYALPGYGMFFWMMFYIEPTQIP